MKLIGHVRELARYPIKSMAGTPAESAFLGWHGLNGDRRFAFRRVGDQSGFPWLSASRLPELLLYHPFGLDESTGEPLPTHVRTPSGAEVELRSKALESEIAERFRGPLELMQLKHGIFDDALVSVINRTTIDTICREAGVEVDTRRFRANILLDTDDVEPFAEDLWVGGRLVFGGDELGESGPAVSVTARDVRCMMINLHPDTAKQEDGRVLKAVVRLNANNAGVYGTVVQTGTIHVGQPVSLIMESA
jgi:MOSC domain-containing protein